jgi:Uma2 family endonuclease
VFNEIDQLHRHSLDEYHRLIESGGLNEATHVELIDGLVLDMSPKTREHETAVAWLAQRLSRALEPARFFVGVNSPLTLDRSEPEPDIFVAPSDGPRPYHHGTALLVVEVALSSLRHDQLIKPRVYAAGRIPEYWVVDVEGERVVRHLEPAGEVYGRVDDVRDTLVASSVELPPLDLRELFAAAFS